MIKSTPWPADETTAEQYPELLLLSTGLSWLGRFLIYILNMNSWCIYGTVRE
jgi:hypothetical protein